MTGTGGQFRSDFRSGARLVSEAKPRAERHGDTIVITGKVEHVWSDPYDFIVKTPEGEKPSGGAGSESAVTAERTGYAERYNRGSGWTQTVRITIPIVDGRLGTPRAEWEDTDEVVDWKTWKPTKPLD